jgi:hypothetical protein
MGGYRELGFLQGELGVHFGLLVEVYGFLEEVGWDGYYETKNFWPRVPLRSCCY